MLQITVWLVDPKKTGIGALISIAISALSTGFASAKIAFDKDVDANGRKNYPKFNGKYKGKRYHCRLFIFVVVIVVFVV